MVRDDKMGTQCALTRLADETFRAIRTTPATAILPGAHKSAAQKRDINRIQIPIASGICVDLRDLDGVEIDQGSDMDNLKLLEGERLIYSMDGSDHKYIKVKNLDTGKVVYAR